MVAIKAVAHFSIPVSDVTRSTRFYTEIVGCNHLATVPGGHMAFLDAAGVCLILVKRDPPINPVLDDHGACTIPSSSDTRNTRRRLTSLRAHGVEITFEGDRQCGVLNGPRAYFHDSDFTIPTARCWSSSTSRTTPAAHPENGLDYRELRTVSSSPH